MPNQFEYVSDCNTLALIDDDAKQVAVAKSGFSDCVGWAEHLHVRVSCLVHRLDLVGLIQD